MAQDADRIVAVLGQAKAKLAEAQRQAFTVLTRLERLRDQVHATLGHSGAGNPALAKMRAAEAAIKARAVEIGALVARVDRAIAQTRAAAAGGGGGGGGPRGGVPAGAGGG